MDRIQPNSTAHHQTVASNPAQGLVPASLHVQHNHPQALSPALLSPNARWALKQTENQPSGFHQLIAELTRNGLADNTLRIQSEQGAYAHYGLQVYMPSEDAMASLTVRGRLNAQAEYDILGIDLNVPVWGTTDSIEIAGPPAAVTRDNASAAMAAGQAPTSTHLAAHYSQQQLASALARQPDQLSVPRAPQPSGASAVTQSTLSSHTSSLTEASASRPAPSRTQATHRVRTGPYTAPRQSDATAGASQRSSRLPRATDEQIKAQLKKPDGTWKARHEIVRALNLDGLAVGTARINTLRQAVGASLTRPAATDEQIRAQLRNPDLTLRSQAEISSALSNGLLGAIPSRINALLREERNAELRSRTMGEQIRASLPSGASAVTQSTLSSHTSSLTEASASRPAPSRTQATHRVRTGPYTAPRQSDATAGASQRSSRLPRATDEQIMEHLYKPDNTLRSRLEIVSILHQAGFAVSVKRVDQLRREAGAPPKRPVATDEQIEAQLKNPDGTWKTRDEIVRALNLGGLAVSTARINPLRQAVGASLTRPAATDEQIRAQLRNADLTLRSQAEISSALSNELLGARPSRINALLREEPDAKPRSRTMGEQMRAHLGDPNRILRSQQGITQSLHQHGLQASTSRIAPLLREEVARAANMPPVSDVLIRVHLRNPNGTFRSSQEVADSLQSSGFEVDLVRIEALLNEAWINDPLRVL